MDRKTFNRGEKQENLDIDIFNQAWHKTIKLFWVINKLQCFSIVDTYTLVLYWRAGSRDCTCNILDFRPCLVSYPSKLECLSLEFKFHPSLIFAGKSRSLSLLWIVIKISARKGSFLATHKRSSFLRREFDHVCKKFYRTGQGKLALGNSISTLLG
jgi:hypothetical protein